MKPEVCFDPDFHANSRRWYWSARPIGPLAMVVACFGLTLAAMAERTTRLVPSGRAQRGFPRIATAVQRQGQGTQARAVVGQPREPFVILAPTGIDPEMVVPAPADMDEAMVFDPETGGQPQVLTAPPLAPRVVPGPRLKPSPVPNRSSPPRIAPRLPAPAQPR